ncbi:MAG TPA: hypothetical protein VH301_08615 [Usitatibacter sp.]|jgi:hypothetical protein|nr:hypothetical protein [Usitatibacter sp.]
MRNKLAARSTSIALAALFAAPAAFADAFMSQDFIKPMEETVTVNLGGILNQFDTSVRFDGEGRRGTDVHLEDNGLGSNLSSFEGSVSWRIAKRHRLDLDYFTTSRSGSRTYATEIDLGNTTFPIGATVSAKAKNDLVDFNYRYSFAQSPELEWAVLLGLYGGKFTYDINAVGNGDSSLTFNKSVSTTLPLPLLGVTVDWYPDRQWKVSGAVQGIAAKIGDVDGHVYRFSAASEYMIARNWGVGVRYVYTDIKADITKTDFNGNLGWRLNSFSAYATFVF